MVTARATSEVIGTRAYPAWANFDGADPGNRVELYARAPWFDTVELDTAGFCEVCATEVYLPCGVPLSSLGSVA